MQSDSSRNNQPSAAPPEGGLGEAVPLVLHIPHASSEIPPDLLRDFTIDAAALAAHHARSVDHFTDELFGGDFTRCTRVEFPISRLAVDPERFERDADEPMAALRLGVLYERGHDGSVIRPPITGARRAEILDRWYRPHHAQLAAAVDRALDAHGQVLIVDCHSFPSAPLAVDHDQRVPRPDLCIGTAGMHTPLAVVQAALACAGRWGCSIAVDAPYAGSVVPIGRLGRDARVRSVMVEVNRDRYMRVRDGRPERIGEFDRTKAMVTELIESMRAALPAVKEVSR